MILRPKSRPLARLDTSDEAFNLLYSGGIFEIIETISMGMPIVYFKGNLNYDLFLSLIVVLFLANSADPDEMKHYAAFHLGLHCLDEVPI